MIISNKNGGKLVETSQEVEGVHDRCTWNSIGRVGNQNLRGRTLMQQKMKYIPSHKKQKSRYNENNHVEIQCKSLSKRFSNKIQC